MPASANAGFAIASASSVGHLKSLEGEKDCGEDAEERDGGVPADKNTDDGQRDAPRILSMSDCTSR